MATATATIPKTPAQEVEGIYREVLKRGLYDRPGEDRASGDAMVQYYTEHPEDRAAFKTRVAQSPEAKMQALYAKYLGRSGTGDEGFWNSVSGWEKDPNLNPESLIQQSAEGKAYAKKAEQRKSVESQVSYMLDPQLKSLSQEHDDLMNSIKEAETELQGSYGTSKSRYDLSKEQTLEDMRMSLEEKRGAIANRLSALGTMYSGQYPGQLEKLSATQQLAEGRIGQQYVADVGELETAYTGGMGKLANQRTLGEAHYGENVAGIQSQREKLEQTLAEQARQQDTQQQQANATLIQNLLNSLAADRQFNANLNFQGQQVGQTPDLGASTTTLTPEYLNSLLTEIFKNLGVIGA